MVCGKTDENDFGLDSSVGGTWEINEQSSGSGYGPKWLMKAECRNCCHRELVNDVADTACHTETALNRSR